MLPAPQDLCVDGILVCIDQFPPIRGRDALPELAQAGATPVAQNIGDDLARETAHGNPKIAVPPLLAKAHDQFINFKRVVVDRRKEILLQVR